MPDDPRYRWNEDSMRYHDRKTGRFVSTDAVFDLLDDEMSKHADRIAALTDDVLDGAVTVESWHASMRKELKKAHLQTGMLGVGGRQQMTQADFGRVGGVLARQYKWLANFADELIRDKFLDSQRGYLVNRAKMYANSARRIFHDSRKQIAKRTGHTHKRRILDPAAAHCGDCTLQAELGEVPIDDGRVTGVADGSTQCRTGCKCRIEFYKRG